MTVMEKDIFQADEYQLPAKTCRSKLILNYLLMLSNFCIAYIFWELFNWVIHKLKNTN